MSPSSGFPAARRSSGAHMPWIDRVANQMEERREDPLGDRLVELRVSGGELEPHLLARRAPKPAHDERHPLEDLRHVHHAHVEDRRT